MKSWLFSCCQAYPPPVLVAGSLFICVFDRFSVQIRRQH